MSAEMWRLVGALELLPVKTKIAVGEMIAFEGHLKDCPPCAGELAELQNVGGLLRMTSASAPPDDEWAGLASGVVSRMSAENHESLRARIGRVFEDMHLVWIALASTTATFLCGAIALGTLQFASPKRFDSMADLVADGDAVVGDRRAFRQRHSKPPAHDSPQTTWRC